MRHTLDNDDGVVDHNTDTQYDRKQGQQIDAKPEQRHKGKGTYDGDRHRGGRN